MSERFDDPDYVKMVQSCLPALLLIRQRNATFKSKRPAGGKITEIVIHDTDSETRKYDATVNYLAKPGDGRMVSIHYIIGREAGQFLSMVPEEMVANHATTHNPRSIGIELWRNEHMEGYTAWQYDALSQLVFDLLRRYSIPRRKVIGHGFFDTTRGGEPEGFEWSQLDDDLHRLSERVRAFESHS